MATWSTYKYDLDSGSTRATTTVEGGYMAPSLRYKVEDDPNDSNKAIVYFEAQIRSRYYSGYSDTILKINGNQVFRGNVFGGTGYDELKHDPNNVTTWSSQVTVNKTSSQQTITYNASVTVIGTGTIPVEVVIPAKPTYAKVKNAGSWKGVKTYMKVAGVWKQASSDYVKKNGVWKVSK